MDYYSFLKFGHIVGFILLGGGLLAVLISELQAYRTSDMKVFAEASRYTAIFYDSLVISGALLVAISGFFLILELGLGFFEEPWVVGMWGLFLFEFIEGSTVTRAQFRKTLRRSRDSLARGGPLTDDIRDEARSLRRNDTHQHDPAAWSPANGARTRLVDYVGTDAPDWAIGKDFDPCRCSICSRMSCYSCLTATAM
jgi:uncharacterized membrane protein